MTKHEIIEKYAKEGKIKKFITNVCKDNKLEQKDFEQDLYLILLETEEVKIVGLYERGELDYYINRIICNQIKSTSSPFYKMYKKNQLLQDEITNKHKDEIADD